MKKWIKSTKRPEIIILIIICMLLNSCGKGGSINSYKGVDRSNNHIVNQSPISNNGKTCTPSDTTKAPGTGSAIKEIIGSQPDMTKASQSNSTTVVRPSGSRIPKGTGKPKGTSIHANK